LSTAYFSPSFTSPIATPATGALMGIPASIIARVPPHTEATDDDPLDSRMPDTTRMVYGQLSALGSTAESARSASAPWPTSRRPGPVILPTSPTENGGKL